MQYLSHGSMKWCVETRQLPDKDWICCVPTLGSSLFRAIGDTPEEARQILEDMKDDLFAWMKENSKAIPRPKIGIYGGTFDPPTKAHLAAADKSRSHLGLDRLFVIPAHQNPLKSRTDISNDADRLAMCNRLFHFDDTEVLDIEMKRDGPSFTYDTLMSLKQESDGDYYIIIGADILPMISKWHNIHLIGKEAFIAVFQRPGYPDAFDSFHELHNLPNGIQFEIMEAVFGECSSTAVRNCTDFNAVHDFVSDEVLDYMREHQLYGGRFSGHK